MGRYGIALVACMIVLAGCAGPRVTSAGDETIADLPAARGWAADGYMLRTDTDLGAPPAGNAAPAAASDGDWPAPPPPPVAAAADETAPVEEAPAAPSEEAPTSGDEEVIEVTPEDVEIQPVAPDAPRLGGCCGGCKKGCCDQGCQHCPCPDPCGNPCGGYLGGSLQFAPGLGIGLEWGINLKRTDCYLLSFEMGTSYQDLYDEFLDPGNVQGATGDDNLGGKAYSMRVGLRWRFKPCCTWHPTLRAGIAWYRFTGGPEHLTLADVGSEGDYLGGYLGAGIEWDLNARWSTGPEVMGFYGVDPESGDTALTWTLLWHINYKF